MVIAHTCINRKNKGQAIVACYYSSPLGTLKIMATAKGVCGIDFSSVSKAVTTAQNPHIKKCIQQLTEYFSGKRQNFDFPLDIQGTKFQMKVWKALQQIPYGHTLAYSDIARKIQNPKATRAVGSANNKNKIAIVIPCHRVISKDGSLTGYGGGLNKKKWLLKHERL